MTNISRSEREPGDSLPEQPALETAAAHELMVVFGQAVALHQAGRPAEAEPLYEQVLRAQPLHFDSLHLLGVALCQRGVFEDAIARIDAALTINPNVAAAHNNLGNALKALGRWQEAIESFDRAIALKPDYAEAFYNRGSVLQDKGMAAEAVADFDRAVAARPNYAEALNNRGNALKKLKRFDDALASFDQAIASNAQYAEAWHNRAGALIALRRFDEALASCDRAIALKPDLVEAFTNRGNALKELRRFDEALDSYECAASLSPAGADTYVNQAIAFGELKRHEDALASVEKAIALKPDHPLAHYLRGSCFLSLKRLAEAVASYARAMELDPHQDHLMGIYLQTKMQICDWTGYDTICADLNAAVAHGIAASYPFQTLIYPSSPDVQLKCARIFVGGKCPPHPQPVWRGERYGHERIRVAYLSSDFRDHPVAALTAPMFACHDRSRFETIGISFGPDEPCPKRERLSANFDRFLNVDTMSDRAVAALMRELEIDIAVDLNGYTDGGRPNVFAYKPVPVQVNYLGYAATLGSDYYDYIIADRFVIPEEARAHFAEKVVYLPDSFMVNHDKRESSGRMPSRADAGLPDAGFVFCDFNNNYKITPDVFDVWMRLLGQVEGSVLWLSAAYHTDAVDNLRREATRRGIAGDRLVFASRVPTIGDHLARLRLADLFLDTLYYNAHASAADALWAGLPLLTCAGATFASRVAGSLLHAVGLPELVTTSVADYEALALALARDPARLAALRAELARNRDVHPLFNVERFTRHLEAAYTTMRDRAERGELPRSFAVPRAG